MNLTLLLIGATSLLGLWLISRAIHWWLAHQHQLEDLRTKRAIRGFHEEKARAIPIGLANQANVVIGADGSVAIEHFKHTPRTTVEEVPAPALPAPTLPIAPPFRQIVSQIAPGHLFLGQGMNGPIWGDVTDLLSTIIAGRPGTGKTTKLRDVCAQVLIIGGLPILFDPHGSIVDDLGTAFQCAESPQEIEMQSTWLMAQLDKRLASRRRGEHIAQPLLLLVDELPVISEMCEKALDAIRRIVLEGRKVSMFALVSGQGVPASILGGTLVRDAMASRYVFCTTPQQARMAGIENETAKRLLTQLENAGPGKAILATARSKPEIVAIPDTTIQDISLLVSRMRKPIDLGSYQEPTQEVDGSLGSDTDDLSSDTLKKALRFVGKRVKNGETPDAIRKSLGVDGGRAHQEVNAAFAVFEEDRP